MRVANCEGDHQSVGPEPAGDGHWGAVGAVLWARPEEEAVLVAGRMSSVMRRVQPVARSRSGRGGIPGPLNGSRMRMNSHNGRPGGAAGECSSCVWGRLAARWSELPRGKLELRLPTRLPRVACRKPDVARVWVETQDSQGARSTRRDESRQTPPQGDCTEIVALRQPSIVLCGVAPSEWRLGPSGQTNAAEVR